MKKLIQVLAFGLFFGLLAWSASRAQTAPQEQASNLAVPDQQSQPKTVVAIILCNTVTGLLIVDDSGEVHPTRFTSKEEVKKLQALVPADHNFALNLGCPGNVSKDTTVL